MSIFACDHFLWDLSGSSQSPPKVALAWAGKIERKKSFELIKYFIAIILAYNHTHAVNCYSITDKPIVGDTLINKKNNCVDVHVYHIKHIKLQ